MGESQGCSADGEGAAAWDVATEVEKQERALAGRRGGNDAWEVAPEAEKRERIQAGRDAREKANKEQ